MTLQEFQNSKNYAHEGVTYLKPVYALALYWTGNLIPQAQATMESFDTFWQLAGARMKCYQTENMKRPKKVDKAIRSIAEEITKQAGRLHNGYLRVDDRSQPSEASGCGWELAAPEYRGVGYLVIRLPVELAESIDLLQFSLQMAGNFEFASGHAGWALSYNELGELASLAELEFYALGMRHPGLDLPFYNNTTFCLRDGIKGANWLTFVGDALAKSKGFAWGKPPQASLTAHRLPHGMAIQAGPKPEIGDVNRRELCADYHAAGRWLAPLRARTHPAVILGANRVMASPERTQEWLARFDS